MGMDISAIELVTKGKILDTRYELKCSCGVYRDFGYMGTTAERWAENHIQRGNDHDVVIHESPAKPLDRAEVIKTLRVKKGRSGRDRATLKIKGTGTTGLVLANRNGRF